MLAQLARNWWALALRGVAAVLFGILVFVWPGISLVVLVALFGAYTFVDGIFALAATARASAEGRPAWPLLVEGLAGIATGLVAVIWPGITTLVLLYVIAAWAVITGVFEILAAVRLRAEIDNEWLLGLGGLASVVFGAFLFVSPGAGILAVLWLIGGYAIFFGMVLVALAFRLRALGPQARSHGPRPLPRQELPEGNMPGEFLANTRPGDHRLPPVGPADEVGGRADPWHEAERPQDTSDRRGPALPGRPKGRAGRGSWPHADYPEERS
jgi:uncharacterized membrane protein HdeD (DUF308 family)